jgi:isocitrate lyase
MSGTNGHTNGNNRIAQQISGRFDGIVRDYTPDEVTRLSGSLPIEYTLAKHGADKLWDYLHTEDYINALGARTGNQAMQQVRQASRPST